MPKQVAVQSPKLEEMETAARELNLNPEKIEGKAYPKNWWEKSGLIKVENIAPKTQIARQIAQKIIDLRKTIQKPKKK